jgi:OOP family OmpA-OmpF porin
MIRLNALPLLGLFVGAAPLAAQHAGQFEVSFAGGYHTYGSATELDGAPGVAGRMGYWFFGPFSLEGEFNYARPRITAENGGRTTVSTFAGWLLGNFPVGSAGSVFLKGGYGSTSYGSCPDVATPGDGPCGSVGVLQGGAGARISLLPILQLRLDGTLNTSLSTRKFSNAMVQGGVSVMLGSPRRPSAPPNLDPDGDGVLEKSDRCPGTPRGARVDASGCSVAPAPTVEPAPAPAVQPPAPQPQAAPVTLPAAPATPPAAKPDTVRAAPDTTKRVPSDPAKAIRPDTARRVNRPDSLRAAPPARARVVILPGTIWNYRSSNINATGRPGLDSLVAMLVENPRLVAEVQGFAHDRLVPADNTLLSQRRAEAIKSYIVSKGVTAGRVTAIGAGSQTLLVNDTTDAARITNRRVEVHLKPGP